YTPESFWPCRVLSDLQRRSVVESTPTQCPSASTTGAPLMRSAANDRAAARRLISWRSVTTAGFIRSLAVSAKTGFLTAIMVGPCRGGERVLADPRPPRSKRGGGVPARRREGACTWRRAGFVAWVAVPALRAGGHWQTVPHTC